MAKLIITSIVILYGLFCATTMPSNCFTVRNAVKCQSVQLSAALENRAVNWPTVWSIR
jgi:hypothetical protein